MSEKNGNLKRCTKIGNSVFCYAKTLCLLVFFVRLFVWFLIMH